MFLLEREARTMTQVAWAKTSRFGTRYFVGARRVKRPEYRAWLDGRDWAEGQRDRRLADCQGALLAERRRTKEMQCA